MCPFFWLRFISTLKTLNCQLTLKNNRSREIEFEKNDYQKPYGRNLKTGRGFLFILHAHDEYIFRLSA